MVRPEAQPARLGPPGAADLNVVELVGSEAGAYCAKLLADLGAQVTLVVDPQDGHWLSQRGLDLYLNVDKQVIVAEPGASEGQWSTLRMETPYLAEADIIIRSSATEALLPFVTPEPSADLASGHDRSSARIEVGISPFGPDGPFSDYRSSDLVDQAMSGHLLLNGDRDREPVQGPEHQVAYAAGAHAAIGALAAVVARHSTGQGQRVEVTHLEVMAALHQFTLLRYTHNGDVLRRMGNRYAGPGTPVGAYTCGDRMISLVVPRDDQLDRLLGVAGLDHLLDQPGIESTYDLMHHPSLDEHLRPWLASQDPAEMVALLQALRVPAGPVNTMGEVLADEHLAERDFWRTADHAPEAIKVPGPPFRLSPAVTGAGSSPAVTGAGSSPAVTGAGSSPAVTGAAGRPSGEPPLRGLRVLDLTRVWAGPFATRILADLGADVVMVEAPWARGPATVDESSVMATRYYPDNEAGQHHWNRIGFFNKYGINKRGLALDLTAPEGRSAFEAMVAEVDVVIENYSPRVMPQLGFDEERLHQLNPSLIYVTMPGFGRTGPAADRVAYGPMIGAHAGLSSLAGYSDDRARMAGVAWPDPVAGMHAALATVGALLSVRAHGVGVTIEVPQLEAAVAMVGHALAQQQLDGHEPDLIGNRHRHHAPQGVYRCRGQDRWLALTVLDDDGWAGLCRLAGFDAAWADWPRDRRRLANDKIDEAIAAWVEGNDPTELADRLQAVGVAAAPVADAPQVMANRQLRAREFFVAVNHPEAGTHEWPRLAINLSDTPAICRSAAPTLNQHGPTILANWAGLDPATIADLEERGITPNHPPE